MEMKDKNYTAKLREVTGEINKVIVGKEDIVEKVLMAILSDGHILLDDIRTLCHRTLQDFQCITKKRANSNIDPEQRCATSS